MSVGALALLAAGMIGDLANVEAAGQRRTATLLTGPVTLVQDGLWELAAPVMFTSVIAPAAVVCLLLYTLLGLKMDRVPPGVRFAFRLHSRLRPWTMTDVFIVGYFVAYSKLGALARIDPGSGFYALFAFMVTTVAINAVVDAQSVWEVIDRRDPATPAAARATSPGPRVVCCETCSLGCEPAGPASRCPRCGARLHRRKRDSIVRTAAFAAAGLILYIPANLYPVLTVVRLGKGNPSTILGGVWELAAVGELPLAVIVFVASVAVPVFKLIGLGAMLLVAVRRRAGNPRHFTTLYRIVAAIGRWSMIDIFMASILGSLVKFGTVATIDPGPGAIAFAAVVILTMLAAESFDPRLMWDKAEP